MSPTTTRFAELRPLDRHEATALAAEENRRYADLLGALSAEEWERPTDCPAWDVRALSGHVLGMVECFTGLRSMFGQMRAAGKVAGDEVFIDKLTSMQVRDRADLTPAELVRRLVDAGPRSARWRSGTPALLRRMPMKESVGGVPETWRMGYLFDTILTRDTWMHRVDVSRAVGRPMVLTPEHDGRLVADVVAEWARRHGQPFTLELTGPAGGRFAHGTGGEQIEIDAVDFCRTLSGRAAGAGLLTQEVPF